VFRWSLSRDECSDENVDNRSIGRHFGLPIIDGGNGPDLDHHRYAAAAHANHGRMALIDRHNIGRRRQPQRWLQEPGFSTQRP